MMIAEDIMDRAASELNMDPAQVSCSLFIETCLKLETTPFIKITVPGDNMSQLILTVPITV